MEGWDVFRRAGLWRVEEGCGPQGLEKTSLEESRGVVVAGTLPRYSGQEQEQMQEEGAYHRGLIPFHYPAARALCRRDNYAPGCGRLTLARAN